MGEGKAVVYIPVEYMRVAELGEECLSVADAMQLAQYEDTAFSYGEEEQVNMSSQRRHAIECPACNNLLNAATNLLRGVRGYLRNESHPFRLGPAEDVGTPLS